MARIIIILFCVLSLSGCVTTQGQGLADKSAQEQIAQLKAENLLLKAQLEEMKKKEVRMPTAIEIQTALKNAGYFKGLIDGRIGPETKDAIKKFQQANNMAPDGVVGSRTWQLLFKYLKK